LKILAVTSTYPRYPGDGVAPFVGSIVSGVADLGHDVHVLVPEHADWRWPARDGRVTFHRYRYSPVRSWTPWGFSESLAGGSTIRKPLYLLAPVVAASAVRAARKILSGGGFDVVHAHWVVPNGPIGRLAAGATPLIVSMHGSDVAVAERSRAFGRVASWTFERASAVTAPSRDLLSRARELGAHEPLELVPYGADEVEVSNDAAAAVRSRLGIAADDVLVVGIGRLIPVKGFDYLVDALADAWSDDRRLRLVLVGDGSERMALADRARSLGVADRVELVGAVAHDNVPEYLAAADVVVVPSIHFDGLVDGLPNVALEAMAAAKPLVATRVGGLPDLVRDDRNGLLVEEKSATELASVIRRLAGDADLRARLGAAARDEIRAERSWESVARRFVEVYERAAAPR
jgi:glycosyltransferase involved in cell wall biosynthesis